MSDCLTELWQYLKAEGTAGRLLFSYQPTDPAAAPVTIATDRCRYLTVLSPGTLLGGTLGIALRCILRTPAMPDTLRLDGHELWHVRVRSSEETAITIATHLAVLAHEAGLRALLIDLDPQRSATQCWRARAAETPPLVETDTSRLCDILADAEAEGIDLTVVDTRRSQETDVERVAVLADFTLVPTRPVHFRSARHPGNPGHRQGSGPTIHDRAERLSAAQRGRRGFGDRGRNWRMPKDGLQRALARKTPEPETAPPQQTAPAVASRPPKADTRIVTALRIAPEILLRLKIAVATNESASMS